jgi:hypothetical protein
LAVTKPGLEKANRQPSSAISVLTTFSAPQAQHSIANVGFVMA